MTAWMTRWLDNQMTKWPNDQMTKGPTDLGKGSQMVSVTHEEKLASAVNQGSIDKNNPSIMITGIFIFTI